MKRVEQMTTTPIENVLSPDFLPQRGRAFFEMWKARVHLEREGGNFQLVPYHESKLGKWHYTFTGDSRMYVWEFPTWRVFVSNKKGVCLEVLLGMHPDDAWSVWREYLDKMGVVL